MNKKEFIYMSPICYVIKMYNEGVILNSSPSTDVGVGDWDDEEIC